MRLSMLTMAHSRRDCTLLFHCASGCLDILRGPARRIALCPGHEAIPEDLAGHIPAEVLSGLVRRGHLVTGTVSGELAAFHEYARILAMQNRWLEMQRGYIMLLLSYACNFACSYCYQKDIRATAGKRRVHPEDIDLFFNAYPQALCPGVSPDNICYILYGGEPLMPLHRPAVDRILARTARDGATVEAVTNGYRLDAFLDLLGKGPGRISKIQVSFDSDQALHDRHRVTVRGGPTFSRILDNVLRAVDTGVDIQIRAHMHRGHPAAAEAFVSTLRDRGLAGAENVTIFLSPIKHDFAATPDLPTAEWCFSPQELLAFAPACDSVLTGYHRQLRRLLDAETGRGPANTAYCMRGKKNCYVIDPAGGIYACYEEAGRPEHRIGECRDGVVRFTPNLDRVLGSGALAGDPMAVSPLTLVTGGRCALTTRRIEALNLADDREMMETSLLQTALGLIADECLARPSLPAEPLWLPLNYTHDADRSLSGLLKRVLPFRDRLEAATAPRPALSGQATRGAACSTSTQSGC